MQDVLNNPLAIKEILVQPGCHGDGKHQLTLPIGTIKRYSVKSERKTPKSKKERKETKRY